MKKTITLIIFLFLFTACIAQQYTWVQKASLPANPRYESVGVSLNGKGYYMTGLGVLPTFYTLYTDNWEYDPTTNSWTQKANFPGTARYGACGFSIGNKIYVGTGWDPTGTTDFYEFDPAANSWSPIANFPGSPRYDAVGFAIGNKGYVGFGYSPNFDDFYEYDPALNSWTQKANFPGGVRQSLSTFSINGLGYVCCGADAGSTMYNDLWQFNPATNGWTQKANFPGVARYATNGFTLNNRGLVGGGWNISQSLNDYYLYNPATDTWCQTATFPAPARYAGDGFVIGQDGYVVLGRDNSNAYYDDFWKLEKAPVSFVINSLPCNLLVGFNSTATNATSYSWTFGDGGTSTLANPTHTYGSLGTYNVQLIVYYSCGTDTVNQQVTLTGTNAVSQFNYIQAPCSYNITFTNSSTGAVSYQWNFGDGNTDTLSNPSHQYATSGNYQVTLYAINACDTDTLQLNINVAAIAPAPTAVYLYSTTPCTYTVNFTNNSLNGTSYYWLYGDGNNSNTSSPNHSYTYAAAGNYNVSLIAINACDTDTVIQQINVPVFNTVQPSFSAQQLFCTNDVQFANNTINGINYLWSFGDGNTSTSVNPLNSYASPGNYTVTLTAYGTCDTIVIQQQITVSSSSTVNAVFNYTVNICDSSVTLNNNSTGANSYLWTFGDGTTSTLSQPFHNYNASGNYTIILTAYNACDTAVSQQNISIATYIPAVAVFNFTALPCSLQVSFNNQSSGAGSYLWTFGDGSTSTLANPVHAYFNAMLYTATLIVTDNCSSDTLSLPVDLTVAVIPSAGFSINTQPCDSIALNFISTSVNGINYHWDFGDGNTSSDSITYNVYSAPGTYVVTLIVTNNCGADTIVQNVTLDPLATPVAGFHFEVTPCTGKVIFTDSSLNADTYNWYFGDGTQSNNQNPEHTFTSTGTFQVTLIINQGQPCTDSLTLPVTIGDVNSTDWFVPNCFTPNDDGLNDVLEIRGLNDCSTYSLKIFNRWGRKIFESGEKQRSWDGKFDSHEVPEGVYMYMVNVEGKEFSGAVTLLR